MKILVGLLIAAGRNEEFSSAVSSIVEAMVIRGADPRQESIVSTFLGASNVGETLVLGDKTAFVAAGCASVDLGDGTSLMYKTFWSGAKGRCEDTLQ